MSIRLIFSLFVISLFVSQSTESMGSLCARARLTAPRHSLASRPLAGQPTRNFFFKPQKPAERNALVKLEDDAKSAEVAKLEEAHVKLVKKHETSKKFQNAHIALTVGLGTCLFFPIVPKVLGCCFITRFVYKAISSSGNQGFAKGRLADWYNRFKK